MGLDATTVCALHPDSPASAVCARCARTVCNSCVVFDASGGVRCTSCAATAGASEITLPWERRGEIGTVPALVGTVKAALLHPAEAFGAPPSDPGLGSPILFSILLQTAGLVMSGLWQIGMMVVTTGGAVGVAELATMSLGLVVVGPFAAIGGIFLWGGIVHLGLLMLGVGRGGFTATARVVGYSSASAVLNVIPFVGSTIAAIWALVITIVGLAAAHKSTPGRTAVAVLGPLVLCCGAGLLAGFGAFLLTRW